MNERLKELAEQAGLEELGDGDWCSLNHPDVRAKHLERFADLVRQDYLRELKELKPVAWISDANYVEGQFVEGRVRRVWWECNTGVGQPLYTAPPRKEWVGLTGTEINHIFAANVGYPERMCRAIEAKLKEKNGGDR
jgi:hypothetical protein